MRVDTHSWMPSAMIPWYIDSKTCLFIIRDRLLVCHKHRKLPAFVVLLILMQKFELIKPMCLCSQDFVNVHSNSQCTQDTLSKQCLQDVHNNCHWSELTAGVGVWPLILWGIAMSGKTEELDYSTQCTSRTFSPGVNFHYFCQSCSSSKN